MADPELERGWRAERLYQERLKDRLEATHRDCFVAIEPDSGDYYLGSTINEAVEAARRAHPDRPPHVIRIGHAAAASILGVRECRDRSIGAGWPTCV